LAKLLNDCFYVNKAIRLFWVVLLFSIFCYPENMNEMQAFGDVFKERQTKEVKKKTVMPPAYQWQELALQIIKDLRIPNIKRNSVFKVCKEQNKEFVLQCLNDTKELCTDGEPWKYFFKIVGNKNKPQGPRVYKSRY